MPATHKSNKTAVPAPDRNVLVDNLLPLYTRGVERLAEFQKGTLDLAAQQHNEWLDYWKKAGSLVPQNPAMFLFDLYGQMFDRFVETQKGAIDLAVEQGEQALNLVKERGISFGNATEGFTALFEQAVDQTVAAQKKTLEFYAEQQKTAYNAIKKQFRFAGSPAVEAMQSGFDTLVETQKAILDAAAKPLHKATAA